MDGHFHEPQTAAAVANEFIALARENSSKLTQMKLQKLVFYAHGWHLGLQKAPLIDEQVEAWPYGPVIPSLYSEFKSFGSKAITRFAQDVDEFGRVFIPRIRRSYDRNLIRRVWEEYGSFSAAQLSSLTHEPGAPWATAQKRNLYELKTFGIDNEVIKNFFEKVASKNRGKVEA